MILLQNTIKPLADLRAHWKEEGCPSIAKIAKSANIPSATAHRYLTGATKGGAPETIRALAIAMDRRDIAESIPYTAIGGSSQANDYISELDLQRQERYNQQLAELTAKHKQEMDDLTRDHRAEREDWHTLRKALHEENVNLRTSFDKAVSFRDAQLRRAHIEKWICFALFLAAVVVLLLC